MIRVLLFVALVASAAAWGYSKNEQKNWDDEYPMCGFANMQSPLDIKRKDAEAFYKSNKYLSNIKIASDDDGIEQDISVKHNGHFISAVASNSTITLSGDPTSSVVYSDYKFDRVDLKWGGSEHTINGRMAAGEAQVFFSKADPNAFGTDEVAIVVLLSRGAKVKKGPYRQIIDVLEEIQTPDSQATLDDFDVMGLFPDKARKDYFFYQGLTTFPPCDKTVTWIVSNEKKSLSSNQFKNFEKLLDEEGDKIKKNCRKTQKYGARKVFNAFEDGSPTLEELLEENSGISVPSADDLIAQMLG